MKLHCDISLERIVETLKHSISSAEDLNDIAYDISLLLEEARQEERNKIKEKLLKWVEEYKIPKEIKANKLWADYIFVYDLKTFVISSL